MIYIVESMGKGRVYTKIEKVVKICQVLHVSADELLETGIK